MSNHTTDDVVAADPAGDGADGIGIELPCHCGYSLRGLPDTGRCPECGREVAVVLGDVEQASLDGRAQRRLGASLLIANHLVWLCMLAGWYVGIRGDLRLTLALLAGAGPRSVTAIEVFHQETIREFATSVAMLTLLQIAGVWALTSVRREEGRRVQRTAGLAMRICYLAATAIAVALLLTISRTDRRMLLWLNLLELPIGFLIGAYVTQLGLGERSHLLVVGGRFVSALLVLGSFAIATFVFWSWSATTRPRPSFYVGLALSAAGGLLLLALLVRIRMLLGREMSDDPDTA